MPRFSKRSMDNLNTCHPDLQRLFVSVVKTHDCTIVCGVRTKAEQDAAYPKFSKVKWPNSKHNVLNPSDLSNAVDVVPYPIDWDDLERFRAFGEVVIARAKDMNIDIRWGADWDGDGDYGDQKFVDAPHYELKGVRHE